MAEDKSKYDKAETLLRDALSKLSEEEVESAAASVELALKYLKAEGESMEADHEEELYGESRNFGIIYNVMEQNAKELYGTKKGRSTIAKFVKEIKSVPVLKEQFAIFSALTKKPSDIDTAEYVNEALDIMAKVNPKKATEANKRLIDILKEGNVNQLVDIEDGKLKLYEAIEFAATNKRCFNTMDGFIKAKKTICENIAEYDPKEEVKNKIVNVDETVDKYGNLLNADEVALIREVAEADDKEALFEKYKQSLIETMKTCRKNADRETAARLNNLAETVKSKGYDPETVIGDIAKYIEIENELTKE